MGVLLDFSREYAEVKVTGGGALQQLRENRKAINSKISFCIHPETTAGM